MEVYYAQHEITIPSSHLPRQHSLTVQSRLRAFQLLLASACRFRHCVGLRKWRQRGEQRVMTPNLLMKINITQHLAFIMGGLEAEIRLV
jgi:hypothetical protein